MTAWADLVHSLPPQVRQAARPWALAHYRTLELRHGKDKARRIAERALERLSPSADLAPVVMLAAILKGEPECPECNATRILDLPDVRQQDMYSCGAAAAMAVGRYFGVGPDELEEWKDALDTTVEQSTHPKKIEAYLAKLGCTVEARGGMTVADLAEAVDAGCPVICPVQDYGLDVPDEADFEYGHYLVVIGVIPPYLMVQDSSADNALSGSSSIAAPGRVLITETTFLHEWRDHDIEGKPYVRYGIVVGPSGVTPVTPGNKALSDIPHYRSATDPARSCGTCGAFADGRCRMFDAAVKPEMTCDEWVKDYEP